VIRLASTESEKQAAIQGYVAEYDVTRVVMLSPEKYQFECQGVTEHIEYEQIIKYKTFYRLVQEIDASTLVVVNECLRTQNRSDLTYNCIRHFLSQTRHQIVFQYLPIIDTVADLMILIDFDTQSRWKGQSFREDMLKELDIAVREPPVKFVEHRVDVTKSDRAAYELKKKSLFDGIGLKDPHTIPRNLYLETGKAKVRAIDAGGLYVGRNNRFKLPGMRSYKETAYDGEHTVFEFPHNVIDFSDFLSLSRQASVPVLTTELKCDQWYLQRYKEWWGRVQDAYSGVSAAQRDRSGKAQDQLRVRFV
jgi:hypothetical protein